MDVFQIVTIVVSLGAMSVSIWQAIEARRSRTDAEAASERVAQAIEAISEPKVPWQIEWSKGNTFTLKNTSQSRLTDVEIEPEGDAIMRTGNLPRTIDGLSSAEFLFVGVMGGTRRIVVSWCWPDGRHDQWRGLVPRRPDK